MTDPTMALLEYLSKFGLQLDDDLIRAGVRAVIQAVIEAEVTQRIGAKRYERSPERTTQRMRQETAAAFASDPMRRAWGR